MPGSKPTASAPPTSLPRVTDDARNEYHREFSHEFHQLLDAGTGRTLTFANIGGTTGTTRYYRLFVSP
jgi:hypothetical protein